MIDKIINLLELQNKKQSDLARYLDLPTGNLSNILTGNGRKFSVEHLNKIASFFDVTVDFLLGHGENVKTKVVPLIGKSSCGIPKNYDLNGYEPIPIPEKMYRDGMYAVEADGESMYPKINHGDIVFCNPTQIIDNGKIVHYCLNGESGIKKYKINEAGTIISLIPLNPNFEIITIHCDELVDLKMAKVVGKIDNDF